MQETKERLADRCEKMQRLADRCKRAEEEEEEEEVEDKEEDFPLRREEETGAVESLEACMMMGSKTEAVLKSRA